jgi:microfibrillar-associated protein 1
MQLLIHAFVSSNFESTMKSLISDGPACINALLHGIEISALSAILMSSTTRKPAPRIARPAARYRKGQIPQGVGELRDSDSDSEDQQDVQEQETDIAIGEEDFVTRQYETSIRPSVKPGTAKSINVALKDVDISTDGKVIVAGRAESGRTAMEGAY